MAALPKRKYAKTRQRLRRQHLKQTRAPRVWCANCQDWAMAHRVCHRCGKYGGRQILPMEDVFA